MGKVAGAQNFDGANWYEQHIAKRTRDVIPDDVCAVFPDVCVHRLILNSKARLQEYTAALILQNVLTSVQKPDIREFSSK